jgi:hypothetical protein
MQIHEIRSKRWLGKTLRSRLSLRERPQVLKVAVQDNETVSSGQDLVVRTPVLRGVRLLLSLQ